MKDYGEMLAWYFAFVWYGGWLLAIGLCLTLLAMFGLHVIDQLKEGK